MFFILIIIYDRNLFNIGFVISIGNLINCATIVQFFVIKFNLVLVLDMCLLILPFSKRWSLSVSQEKSLENNKKRSLETLIRIGEIFDNLSVTIICD